MSLIKLLVWKVRHVLWTWSLPYSFGDPSLGHGEVRDYNRSLLRKRHYDNEPRRPEKG